MERKPLEFVKELEDQNWPIFGGRYICTKEKPMPLEFKNKGFWNHSDGMHETDYDGDYYIEYICDCCGHVWRREMPD